MKLDGKHGLVTGASSGIGRALAFALGKAGVRLALAARRASALEQLSSDISSAGGVPPIVFTMDLSERGGATTLAARALGALGRVDLLINCAGQGAGGSQWSMGDGALAREVFETNYFAPLALIQALVPAMRARHLGAIVNISSIGALVAAPLVGHYGSTKAALALATEALRLELRGSGVQVLHVIPGPIETAMLAELREVPGGTEVVRQLPHGTPDVLARRIVHALERGRETLVYPRSLAILRYAPLLAARCAAWLTRKVDPETVPVLKGGESGNMRVRGNAGPPPSNADRTTT